MKLAKVAALSAASLLVFASTSYAGGDYSYESVSGPSKWYIGAMGGVGYAGDLSDRDSSSSSTRYKSDFDRGLSAGAFLGYKFTDNMRLEGQYGYMQNDGSDFKVGGTKLKNVGGVTASAFMLNGYYDFTQLSERFTPYVGVGLGALYISYDVKSKVSGNNSKIDGNDTVLGYQGIVGARYKLNPDFSLGLDYRYLRGTQGNFTTKTSTGTKNSIDHAYSNQMVNFSIIMNF